MTRSTTAKLVGGLEGTARLDGITRCIIQLFIERLYAEVFIIGQFPSLCYV
jgi:hypothetical protein